jgi:hypothetical protein
MLVLLLSTFQVALAAQKLPYSIQDFAIPGLGLSVNGEHSSIEDGEKIGTSLPRVRCVYGIDNQYTGGLDSHIIVDIYYMNPADNSKAQSEFPAKVENQKGFADKGDFGPVVEFNSDPSPTFPYRLSEVTLGTKAPYVGQPFGARDLLNNEVLVTIECYLIGSSGPETVAALNKVENKVAEILNKGKPVLALTHYSAFDPEVLRNKANGGDVVATMTVEGKPVAGEKVYFFLAADKNGNSDTIFLPNVIDPQYLSSYSAMHVSGLGPSDRVNFGDYALATTNAKGSASINYISSGYLDYVKLEKWLREHGSVKYSVLAYVFEEPLEKTQKEGKEPKIKCYAIAPIEYQSMAAIVHVQDRDLYDVRVIKAAEKFPGQVVHSENCPYGISPGDFVLMAEGTSVTVAWIPGVRLKITPKEKYFLEGSQYATFTIGSKDMGWTQTGIDTIKGLEALHIAATPVEILIEGHLFLPAVKFLALTGILGAIEHKVDATQGPIEIERVRDPILIGPNSRILVDMDNTTTIYTLEGTATVYNAAGTSVDVTTGNQLAVDPAGTPGTVTTFSESQLGADEKRLLSYAQSVSPVSSGPDTAGSQGGSSSNSSPAPGLLAGALAIVAVICLLRRRRGP